MMLRVLYRHFEICAVLERPRMGFWGQNVRICSAVRALLRRNGAAVIVQQGRCRNATEAPLRRNKALTAEKGHFSHASGGFRPF